MFRTELFRPEAVEFQKNNRQWGHVAALQPLSSKVFTWLIAAAVALVIPLLVLGQYARKETVVGFLTPTSGTAKIFVPQLGTIAKVHVKEGQLVQQGQPLLTVETSQVAINGQDVNATVLATLLSQKDLLNKQIAREQDRSTSEHERLTAVIGGLETEINRLQSEITTQSERIRISERLVSATTELHAKGYMTDIEFRKRQLDALEQHQNLDALGQQLAARQNDLTEARYSLQQLPVATAEKIQNLRNELSDTEQRIAEFNGRQAYVLRAPTAGRVSTLQATVGQFADPKRLQMEIVPADSALEAELFVPTRAIGFVRPGQEVRILYEAFPYQQFGAYRGSVTEVSQTILTGNDASGPIGLKDPAYRVTASLDRQNIDAYGKTIPLQDDMLLQADIILEKRSLLRWLLDPLLSVRM
jgi:membrane fusion protein